MYSHVLKALDDIRERASRQSNALSMAYRGQPFTAVADAQADRPLATLYFINATSAFDDALDIYIQNTFPGVKSEKVDTFGKRISFLERQSALKSSAQLRKHKEMRNAYAHEVGNHAEWSDLWQVLADIDVELKHLGIKA